MRNKRDGRRKWKVDRYSFHSTALISVVAHLILVTYALLSKCSAKDNRFFMSYFSNSDISNSMFHREKLLRRLSSTTEIWLKLCSHYWSGFRKVYVVMRCVRHFSKYNSQVCSALGPTIFGVYPHHQMECVAYSI